MTSTGPAAEPPPGTQAPPVDGPASYADALAELDAILLGLEDDRVDVDRLGAQVRRAAELIAFCRGRIVAARLEVADVATADVTADEASTLP